MSRAGNGMNPPAGGGDSWVFSTIFVASFMLLLGVALVAQLCTWQWRSWLPGAENEKSVVAGVKAAVYSFLPHLT
jgi:light-harvesting complex 1 beta chain